LSKGGGLLYQRGDVTKRRTFCGKKRGCCPTEKEISLRKKGVLKEKVWGARAPIVAKTQSGKNSRSQERDVEGGVENKAPARVSFSHCTLKGRRPSRGLRNRASRSN